MRTILPALLLLASCAKMGAPGRLESPRMRSMPAEEAYAGESYDAYVDNPVIATAEQTRSTFAIDVDTASMSNVRRFLEDGQLPPEAAVRTEEMINYFDYGYPDPSDGYPFAVVTEMAPSPFHAGDQIVHVGLQGKRVAEEDRPPVNLVFLIDTSGSMDDPDKLPLVKEGFALLVERLKPDDRVGIVAYAGEAGVVLEPTSGENKDTILAAIAGLGAGGSTAGAGGLQAAYDLARAHFSKKGVNRVILATDGDFNVGITDEGELVKLITDQAKSGIALTVLGFGTGNYQDSRMEKLADHGNGNYAYIDEIAEARKVFVEQGGSTLVTIAQDVKVQVEFDPAQVESFRLIGYENRVMANQGFRNDAKDAGELGAGHNVTALYEITPAKGADAAKAFATVRLRWQPPGGGEATEIAVEAKTGAKKLAGASDDLRFASAVAGFAMLLRGSEHRGDATWVGVRDLALDASGDDTRRLQLVSLIESAARLSGVDLGPQVAR
jgi:Ca-activated chloride channel family protein